MHELNLLRVKSLIIMMLRANKLCKNHPENLKRSKDGRCTKCESERRIKYRSSNLEKELARRASNRDRENELSRKRYSENPEIRRADSARYRSRNQDKIRKYNAVVYQSNPEFHKARIKQWKSNNPEKIRAQSIIWRRSNPEKVRAMNQRHYAKADKSKIAENNRAWREANREKVRASVRKWNNENAPDRKAKKKAEEYNATPLWANDFFIKEAYRLARHRTQLFGFKWQVDHIVPIISKHVCGLHCEDNMQVIPAKHNAAKGNRWWPDMPVIEANKCQRY